MTMAEYRLFDPADPPDWLTPPVLAAEPHYDHLSHPAGVHAARITRAAELATEVVDRYLLDGVVDLGCGDGATLARIPGRMLRYGIDISYENAAYAWDYRGLHSFDFDVVTEDWRNRVLPGRYLLVCTEFLEHLADPGAFLRAQGERAPWLLASSPWQEDDVAHEDNHAWAWDTPGYVELLNRNGWEVEETELVEWTTMVVAHSTDPKWATP